MTSSSDDEFVPAKSLILRKNAKGKELKRKTKEKVQRSKKRTKLPAVNSLDIIIPSSSTPPTLQFQDDKTGRKHIHPAALRYCLKIIEDELVISIQSVSESLMQRNKAEESRTFQIQSHASGRAIIAKVRERLRTVLIPMRYVRIDDVGLADLESTNKKRVDEIETTTSELEQLKVKKKELEKDHSEARITRHDAMERMKSNNDHKECQSHLNRRCHALLQNIQSPGGEVQCEIKKMQPVKRPESNLLFKSFESLSSPYDD